MQAYPLQENHADLRLHQLLQYDLIVGRNLAAGGQVCAGSGRQVSGLEAWQGQGLDEVLRPVQPTRSVQPSEAEPGSLHHQPSCCTPILP